MALISITLVPDPGNRWSHTGFLIRFETLDYHPLTAGLAPSD